MSGEIAITDPCVVFALRRESIFFRRIYSFQQRFPGAPCRAQFRGPPSQTVVMLETGLGAESMEKALRWCLSGPLFGGVPYRPRFVLSAGFSGSLRPGLRVGDLVVATEVLDRAGNRWSVSGIGKYPRDDSSVLGALLTVPELVGDPLEKQRLGEKHQAVAVDMETARLARLCLERHMPFACLRVISDTLDQPLSPRLVELLRRGRVSPWRLGLALIRQPRLVSELLRLARQTRRAASRLVALRNFLEHE
jgi:nucleoside phosphorylase